MSRRSGWRRSPTWFLGVSGRGPRWGLLLDALGQTEGSGASFSFTWPGIEQARLDARAATTATLVPDPDARSTGTTARDVLIEGDNLQVLKLLKAGYSGAAKLIYIDPPYNTGDTFTYNDDYSVPESEYLQADRTGRRAGQRHHQQAREGRQEARAVAHA